MPFLLDDNTVFQPDRELANEVEELYGIPRRADETAMVYLERLFGGPTPLLNPSRTGAGAPGGDPLTESRTGGGVFNDGSGGGGGGVSGPSSAEQRRALSGALATSAFGVLPFNVDGHIAATVAAKGTTSSLIDRIINDPRFERAFPGIKDDDGNLRMTPTEYVQQRQQFDLIAGQYSRRISRKEFGTLVAGEVSANEFSERMTAWQTMRENKDVLKAFNRVLADKGLKPLENTRDVFLFLSDRKPKRFYDVYEQAAIEGAATELGIDLDPGRVKRLARRTQGVVAFSEAARALRTAREQFGFASAELRAIGLTEKDLQNVSFGLDPALAGDVERTLRQRQANISQGEARQGLGLTEEGRITTQNPSLPEGG